MNILVSVGASTYATENQVDVYLSIATNTGLLTEGATSINFSQSATQLNSALIAYAKQRLKDVFNYTVLTSDIVKLMGGAV